jgi:hypothetical protein
MSKLPNWLLGLAGHDEVRSRILAEASRNADRRALDEEVAADDAQFRNLMRETAKVPHVTIGTTLAGLPYRISLSDLTSLPAWITAATGAGKSRFIGAFMARVIEAITRGAPVSIVLLDGKGELADQQQRSLAATAAELPKSAQTALLSRVYTFNFFDSAYLPSWPIMLPEPGVPIEAQADALAEVLLEVVADGTVGPRQRATLSAFEALSIEQGVPFAAQPWLLSSAEQVEDLASRSSLPSVRLELSRFSRESQTSVDGLVARLNTLLRTPSLKAILSGSRPFHFRTCFEPGNISIFSFGGSPAGARAAVRATGSLVISSLVNAVFDPRRLTRGTTLFVIDEPQAMLSSVSLGQLERLLTLGRSFGSGGLVLAHQGASQLPKELASLLGTNIAMRALGRSSEADATAASEWLPTTRVVPRPRTPGSGRRAEQFLSESEERRFRIHEIGRLPARHFLIADRRAVVQPRIVRAPEHNPPAWSEIDPAIADAVRKGAAGVPRSELEAQVRRIEELASARFEDALRNNPEAGGRRSRSAVTPDVVGQWKKGGPGGVP